MLNRKLFVAVVLSVLLIGFSLCASFYWGAHIGAELSQNGMAPFRGYLVYKDIERIKKGNTQELLNAKEADIDDELYFWGKYLENGEQLGNLLFPNNDYGREKFIRAIAKYRVENPHDNVADIQQFDEHFAKERQKIINNVLNRYGSSKSKKIDRVRHD